jgi:FMN phosphatase YigB (HAD superfamily)
MKNAVVFDWDGTIVSCEEKIDQTIGRLRLVFPLALVEYDNIISCNGMSPGWIKNGFLASLSEDYFTYHFGILADVMARMQSISIDEAWGVILCEFRSLYIKSVAKLLLEYECLERLSCFARIYIVSNSETDNVKTEMKRFFLDTLDIAIIGGAKKYQVKKACPSICGIPTDRPAYQKIIQDIREKFDNMIIVGDNFCCDLATPLSIGVRGAYIPNAFTPEIVKHLVLKRGIICGTVQDITEIILTEFRR